MRDDERLDLGPEAVERTDLDVGELVPCLAGKPPRRQHLHGADATGAGTTVLDVATIVIPFAGVEGKTRLALPAAARRVLSLAMLGDVLEAALAVGDVRVVTPDAEGALLARAAGADAVERSGRRPGRGGARGARRARRGPRARRQRRPAVRVERCACGAARGDARRGLALVEAADGTTNALGLSSAAAFAPLYGPGSAARFRAHAAASGLAAVALALPELATDADTVDDLRSLGHGCGPRTQACLAALLAGTAA